MMLIYDENKQSEKHNTEN